MPNRIAPSAVIGPDVTLGDGNIIGPGAVIAGPATIGDDNWIGPGVIIGGPPEIRGAEHAPDWLERPAGLPVEIGSHNIIREHAVITGGSRGATVVGDDCYIMSKCHVAHDGQIGDGATMSIGATLAGHVHVGASANIGIGTVVHQFRWIGAGAMVGMGTVVTHDVPPYAKAYGNPVRVHSANTVGMSRSGVDETVVAVIDAAYQAGKDPLDSGASLGKLAGVFAAWARRPK
ncbi:MAG: hypothetical protein LBM66_07955 [Bifidobacteriaceae bacterium]|nr:hypothetical protein [Bifidobacteriaceae bacterium]